MREYSARLLKSILSPAPDSRPAGAKPLLTGRFQLLTLLSMTTTIERIAKQAKKLPSESRARLADILVESLDADKIGAIDRLWLSEAMRRRDEVREGRVKPASGAESVVQRIRKKKK